MSVTAMQRPSLRDLRPLKADLPGRTRTLLGKLSHKRSDHLLASLPVLSAGFAVLAAWDIARPLGLAVASIACLLLEFRFTEEQ